MKNSMTASQIRRRRRAEESVEAATISSERVASKARTLSETLMNRDERKRTNPFIEVELDGEDSLVTSIENVIAVSHEQSATSSEISGDKPIKNDSGEPKAPS